MTSSPPANLGFWEKLYRFRQKVDDALEEYQSRNLGLEPILGKMVEFFQVELGVEAASVRLSPRPEGPQAGLAETQVFSTRGFPKEFLQAISPEKGWSSPNGKHSIFSAEIEVHGLEIGVLSVIPSEGEQDRTWIQAASRAFAEQVDNVVFEALQARRRHRLTVEVQKGLANPVFELGLDEAVSSLFEALPLAQALFVYRNEHVLYPDRLQYRLYGSEGTPTQSDTDIPDPELEAVLAKIALEDLQVEDLPPGYQLRESFYQNLPLEAGTLSPQLLGRMITWLKPGSPGYEAVTQSEILTATVLQRLADYSKETRTLEKYFSPETVIRLLRSPTYLESHLKPRLATVGILFVDVAGFTSLSETALADPTDTGHFIDLWSEGTARILMEHSGVMDKLIGDCVMGLFGPPFFEEDPAELAGNVTRAALEIQAFTRDLIDHPALEKLRPALLEAGGLDVSTGVHLGEVSVGIFGPNRDYTAFGSAINNCARIQSHARPGQTLAIQALVDALNAGREEDQRGITWGESGSFQAKNVAEPIRYVEVLPLEKSGS